MKDKKWMRKALSFLLAVFMVTGSKALSGNTELESVNKAFTVTGDFVFAVRDDSTGIVVVKYNGTASTLTVPNTVAGLPVVERAGVRGQHEAQERNPARDD